MAEDKGWSSCRRQIEGACEIAARSGRRPARSLANVLKNSPAPPADPIGERGLRAVIGLFGVLAWCGSVTFAQSPDKSAYHLFDPTPRAQMRELSADRPDVTESPYTVDAGHVQVELSWLDYVRDDDGPGTTETFSVLPSNLKVGLLDNVDLQIVIDPYIDVDVDDADDDDDANANGFGDMVLRLKVNLWGNDGGQTAFAVMPYLQFPTGDDDLSADHTQGGLIFPLAISLNDRLGLGLMGEFDFVYDDADDEYDTEFVHTASLAITLSDRWGSYLEYIGIEPFDGDGDYLAHVGTGLTYAVNADVQLDVGTMVGLNEEADDFQLFSGLTVRR